MHFGGEASAPRATVMHHSSRPRTFDVGWEHVECVVEVLLCELSVPFHFKVLLQKMHTPKGNLGFWLSVSCCNIFWVSTAIELAKCTITILSVSVPCKFPNNSELELTVSDLLCNQMTLLWKTGLLLHSIFLGSQKSEPGMTLHPSLPHSSITSQVSC